MVISLRKEPLLVDGHYYISWPPRSRSRSFSSAALCSCSRLVGTGHALPLIVKVTPLLRLMLARPVRLPERPKIGKTQAGKLPLHVCLQVFDLKFQVAACRFLFLSKVTALGDIPELKFFRRQQQ